MSMSILKDRAHRNLFDESSLDENIIALKQNFYIKYTL